jgi:hypothetical protein
VPSGATQILEHGGSADDFGAAAVLPAENGN